MVGSNISSGLGRSALCETLESRNFFSSTVGLDPAFRGGVVQTRFGGDYETATNALPLKDGRLLVTGYTIAKDGNHFVAAVYNKDGTLSNRFDGDGKLTLSYDNTQNIGNQITDLLQTPDGGVLLVGDFKQLKIKLTGQIDTSYGTGGFAARLWQGSDRSGSVIELPDGTTREVGGYEPGEDTTETVYLRDIDAHGKLVRNLQRKIGESYITFARPDATGVTVLDESRNIYRFNAKDLSKVTSFGNGGVIDADVAIAKYVASHGPFTTFGKPAPAGSVYFVPDQPFDAKGGFGFTAISDSVAPNTPTFQTPGPSPFSFSRISVVVSADGKNVTITGGDPAGKVLAHTSFTPSTFDTHYVTHFGGTFHTLAGLTETLTDILDDTLGQAYFAVQAADGSFYVVGTTTTNTQTPSASRFTVIHTKVV